MRQHILKFLLIAALFRPASLHPSYWDAASPMPKKIVLYDPHALNPQMQQQALEIEATEVCPWNVPKKSLAQILAQRFSSSMEERGRPAQAYNLQSVPAKGSFELQNAHETLYVIDDEPQVAQKIILAKPVKKKKKKEAHSQMQEQPKDENNSPKYKTTEKFDACKEEASLAQEKEPKIIASSQRHLIDSKDLVIDSKDLEGRRNELSSRRRGMLRAPEENVFDEQEEIEWYQSQRPLQGHPQQYRHMMPAQAPMSFAQAPIYNQPVMQPINYQQPIMQQPVMQPMPMQMYQPQMNNNVALAMQLQAQAMNMQAQASSLMMQGQQVQPQMPMSFQVVSPVQMQPQGVVSYPVQNVNKSFDEKSFLSSTNQELSPKYFAEVYRGSIHEKSPKKRKKIYLLNRLNDLAQKGDYTLHKVRNLIDFEFEIMERLLQGVGGFELEKAVRDRNIELNHVPPEVSDTFALILEIATNNDTDFLSPKYSYMMKRGKKSDVFVAKNKSRKIFLKRAMNMLERYDIIIQQIQKHMANRR